MALFSNNTLRAADSCVQIKIYFLNFKNRGKENKFFSNYIALDYSSYIYTIYFPKPMSEMFLCQQFILLPVTSLMMILETTEKCLLLLLAMLAAAGRMSPTWAHSREQYFLRSEAAPCISRPNGKKK